MEIKKITDQNHDEVVKSHKLVLIKFGAEWCPPCQMIKPELEAVAAETKDALVAEGDIDDEAITSLKAKYNVQTIPHVVLLKNGEIVEHFIGYKPRGAILELINKHK